MLSQSLHICFQPILDLTSGSVSGVEALARLQHGQRILPPCEFIPSLSRDELGELLLGVLDAGAALLARCSETHPTLTLSINVTSRTLLEPGIQSALLQAVRSSGLEPRRIIIEILESEDFGCWKSARELVARLRQTGIGVALDDVGTAYSSLRRLKELPVDIIKLDGEFVRGLDRKPEDLLFIYSMVSLARGLRKRLVVEGVEKPEILDALTVLGVEAAQGYAIARPLPAETLMQWLRGHVAARAGKKPRSLLGAYASHLCFVEACRAMAHRPLTSAWPDGIENPHKCFIGRFFDEKGWHDTDFGRAHKAFHAVLPHYDTDPEAWEHAVERVRDTLSDAIRRQAVT